jgi:hypothetical protein
MYTPGDKIFQMSEPVGKCKPKGNQQNSYNKQQYFFKHKNFLAQ